LSEGLWGDVSKGWNIQRKRTEKEGDIALKHK